MRYDLYFEAKQGAVDDFKRRLLKNERHKIVRVRSQDSFVDYALTTVLRMMSYDIDVNIGNHLRTFELENRVLETHYPFDEFLSAAAYAVRCTYHTTLQATPGQLVFGRDMHLPTRFIADWALIATRKQREINRNNERENRKRIDWDYVVGQQVLLDKPGIVPKLTSPRTGPYTITQVHANGTVTIQRGPTTERVNIRRITPYFVK